MGQSSVREILQNPVYRGSVRLNGVEYPGAHQPLVSAEVWDTVQALRAARGAKHGRVSVRPGRSAYGALTEISFCAICGSRLWYSFSGSNAAHPYYTCSGRSRRTCMARGTRADLIEAKVLDMIKVLAIPKALTAEIIRRAERLIAQDATTAPIDRQAIESRMQRLTEVYISGRIDSSRYTAEMAELER